MFIITVAIIFIVIIVIIIYISIIIIVATIIISPTLFIFLSALLLFEFVAAVSILPVFITVFESCATCTLNLASCSIGIEKSNLPRF